MGTWLAVHPSNTKTVRIPDAEDGIAFEVGFWPPRIAESIRTRLLAVFGHTKSDPVTLENMRAEIEKAENAHDVMRDMARFGIRGWKDGDAEATASPVKQRDGREFPELSPEQLDTLSVNSIPSKAHGRPTELLTLAAMAAYEFNTLSPSEKKASTSP